MDAGGIRAQLLPIAGAELLLPNCAIAEIVDYQPPETAPGGPQWLLGWFEWRGLRVPLLSFEAASGDAPSAASRRCRIAVLNRQAGDSPAPFMALALHGIPHLIRLREGELLAVAEPVKAPALCAVQVGSRTAVIPDLLTVENMLRETLQ